MIELKFPKEDPPKIILHLWKIIDLKMISRVDLVYLISFKIYLMPPDKADNFIKKSIENSLLKINSDNMISLANKLEEKFNIWQEKREEIIKRKEEEIKAKVHILKDLNKKKNTNFNSLLKIFSDKGTINRAISISTESITLSALDQEKQFTKAEFLGTKNEIYFIEIDIKKKIIKHNCHDYIERRAPNKKFCKHLTRLFLILKEKNQTFIENLLDILAESINEWEFIS